MNKSLHLALALALATSGCATLVPPLPQARADIPAQWPHASNLPATTTAPLVDVEWRTVIADARLQRVVAQAIEHNRDLRVAVLNVERARAQYGIQRAARLPAIGANAGMERIGGDVPDSENYTAGVGLAAFELDLFGRVRNLSEAALQQFFAQQENRRAAQLALVAGVADAWLALAADQARLAIAQDSLRTYEEGLRLAQRRHEIGVISGLELAQARTQVETARMDAAQYAGNVARDRHALDLLAGAPVLAADLPQALDETVVAMPPLPAQLSSQVLLRRPDILAAEHALLAANANIGAARAAFFPSISLTGSAGSSSGSLGELFETGTRLWRFAPQITLPIFSGGRLRAGLGMATAERDIALANYEKAIQTGFREVADALALADTLTQRRDAAERLLEAARRADMLSQERYRAGRDSYLVRLDAQRTLYAAQQAALAARWAQQSNRVALYRALGGGAP